MRTYPAQPIKAAFQRWRGVYEGIPGTDTPIPRSGIGVSVAGIQQPRHLIPRLAPPHSQTVLNPEARRLGDDLRRRREPDRPANLFRLDIRPAIQHLAVEDQNVSK